MIQTNICGRKYLNIFEYPNIRHTMVWWRAKAAQRDLCGERKKKSRVV